MGLRSEDPRRNAAGGLPFQIRGGLQTILALRLIDPEHPDFYRLLVDKIAHSPDFFRQAPVVLDVGALGEGTVPVLADLVDRLRQQRLAPVGVQNGSETWMEAAQALGLAVFGAGAPAELPSRPREAASRAPAGAAPVVASTIRGGQRVHRAEGDLVVLAPVGHGAELSASGHIHVYGALRGRAFAGIGGDESAMIFCDQLEAELLSIAGVHLVNEEIEARHIGRRVRVRLAGNRLAIEQPT